MRAMTYRSVSRAARTGMPGAEASMIRLFFSELHAAHRRARDGDPRAADPRLGRRGVRRATARRQRGELGRAAT